MKKKLNKRSTSKKRGGFFSAAGNVLTYPFRAMNTIVFLGMVFIVIAVVFSHRLYTLQVVQGAEMRERVDNQFTRIEQGRSISRGDMFFTTKDGGRVLAASTRPLYTVAIEPRVITDAESLYMSVSEIMKVDKETFVARASKADDPYEEIALKVEREVVDQLKEIEEPGLLFVLQRERYYPGGDIASSVLGFMSFKGDEFRGSYGLEKYYDAILRRDSVKKQSIFKTLFSQDTKTGDENENETSISKNIQKEGSLVLTIEPTVQAVLEKELDSIVEEFGSKYAAGIIMNSDTGEIIAMGTSDNIDLNNNTRHYRNYLIEDRLELGSIIKPLTIAIGLESDAINTNFSYDDKGVMIIDRYPIRNFDRRGRGPFTDIQTILSQSLNTGVATIALQVGNDTFKSYLYDLGFDTETGIDLPGEVFGLTSNLESGRDVEIATASFGQGIAITPIEAVRALASIHNGGSLVTPRVVSSIEYGDLIPTRSVTYQSDENIFSQKVTDQVLEYMVNTVDNTDTFSPYSNANYSVGIKTGTAQIASPTGGYYEDKFLHSMIGFVPAFANEEQDKFTILIYNVEPQDVRYSSTTLKNQMFRLTEFLINYYQIPPDRLQLESI